MKEDSSQNDPVDSGKRMIKLTEKYRDYQTEGKLNAIKKIHTELSKLNDEALTTLTESKGKEVSEVSEQLLDLRKLINERKEALDKLCHEVETNDPTVDLTEYLRITEQLVPTISSITEFVGVPRHFRSGGSVVSRSSSRSGKSARSSISNKRAEVAALNAKLERERLENKLKLEVEMAKNKLASAKIETELEVAKAELKVYEEDELRLPPGTRIDVTQRVTKSEHTAPPTNNSVAHPEVYNNLVNGDSGMNVRTAPSETSSTCSNISSAASIAEAVSQALALCRLPVPEPPVFSGDPEQYAEWDSAFSTLIDSKGIPAQERIFYLRKYLAGSAKTAVSECLKLKSEEAFQKARDILKKRYGNNFTTAQIFKKKLDEWPKIASNDPKSLLKYSDFLSQCYTAMSELNGLQRWNEIDDIFNMALKLPDFYYKRWKSQVAHTRRTKSTYPKFKQFVDFVYEAADTENEPSAPPPKPTSKPPTREPRTDKHAFVNETEQANKENVHHVFRSEAQTPKQCRFCSKKGHSLDVCHAFQRKPLNDRRQYVKTEKLCFACLKPGHLSRDCKSKAQCNTCNKPHPSCLHDETFKGKSKKIDNTNKDDNDKQQHDSHSKKTTNSAQSSHSLTSMIVPVYLSSKSYPDKEVLVYAMLDTMSDSTFVSSLASTHLETKNEPVKLRLTTMNASDLVDTKLHKDLQVRGFFSSTKYSLPDTFERSDIPMSESHIPTPATADKWSHLTDIREVIAPKQQCPVALLIGYDCPLLLAPTQCIMGNPGDPFGLETRLGWCIVGGSSNRSDSSNVNRIKTNKVTAKEVLNLLERDCISPSVDTEYEIKLSQNDIKFLEILKNGISQNNKGHYQMPLPFKNGPPTLADNRNAALGRLASLKKQLLKNPNYQEQYIQFMNKIIESNEAEIAPKGTKGQMWYIPHHGVYHPHKPNKLRVVFDCSTRVLNDCLNDQLLQGPDLNNTLLGVLLRFRKGQIAFTCDVERMFHQFYVLPEHTDYFRFLWWEGGDLSQPPTDYRMRVHLFGATSSPGCAVFALKQIANDFRHLSTKASDFLLNSFYVDDGLQSEDSLEDAKETITKAKEICQKANLTLHKISSNCKEILKAVESSDASTSVEISTESTLGMGWSTEDDTLRLKIKSKSSPATRRGLLATIAAVYDPVGFVAPFVLQGRQILQHLCSQSFDWDTPLPNDINASWNCWLDQLSMLECFSIPRCYFPANFGLPVSVEFHHFSDASTSGYGQCTYLRCKNAAGNIHCSFVFAKAKVAPLKPVTIPRLELQAATLSAKVAKNLEGELKFPNATHTFWSDSKIVLGYIKNDSKRFHLFVANRVQIIREISFPDQWHYVPTNDNPADLASRGLSVTELQSSMWLRGPDFLWQTEIKPVEVDLETSNDDKEVKSSTSHAIQTGAFSSFEERIARFSDLKRLITAFSVIFRKIMLFKGTERSTLQIRSSVMQALIHNVQLEHFSILPKGLIPLSPYRDEHGLLRVGGRQVRSDDDDSVKHPIILPKTGHLSHLLAKQAHAEVAHLGRNTTMNQVRSQGFWIVGCRSVTSAVIHKCQRCIKLRGKPVTQIMADLPKERLTPSPPFTHCGIDVFGPFTVKEGRKEMKKYGLIFTCLSLRAVHIEMLDDMSTDCFINSLRCFVAIRGKVETLYCDNGSNFVGASNEFRTNVKSRLVDYGCEFHFNPPSASHFGGVWERQIRTVRNILSGLVDSSQGRLDSSSLRTLFYEASAIVNSRPLTVENLDRYDGPVPLAPNHLLTGKSTATPPPPGSFPKEDLYLRKRWRRVQHLTEVFWGRWKMEYLANLQTRQKWKKKEHNIEIGDVVLLQDDGLCRADWTLARVTEVFASQDGLVRKVKLLLATSSLDKKGKPKGQRVYLQRPVHKLVVLVKGT